jgi:hypothetical protein
LDVAGVIENADDGDRRDKITHPNLSFPDLLNLFLLSHHLAQCSAVMEAPC